MKLPMIRGLKKKDLDRPHIAYLGPKCKLIVFNLCTPPPPPPICDDLEPMAQLHYAEIKYSDGLKIVR